MPSSVNELVIRISGDIKDFQSSLGDATAATEGFNFSLLGIAALATAAFAAVVEGAKFSLEKYHEHEQATNSLTLALQNQGLYSDLLMESYRGMAEQLQRVTGIDADAIVKGQARLQSMIGQTAITKEMTAAAVNLGAAMGGDVNSGFEIIGRAIDGNVRGLKQFGIEIDQHLTKEERTAEVLRKVETAYGGVAEKQNTGLGSVKGLNTAVVDLAKDFGESLAPSVTSVIGVMTKFFETLHDENKKNKDPFVRINQEIENVEISIANLKSSSANAFSGLNADQQTASLKEANRQLDILLAKRDDMQKASRGKSVGQDPEKEKAAKLEHAIQVDKQNRERESLNAHNAAMKIAVESHSKDVVDLYKEEAEIESAIADDKNKRIRTQLEDHLKTIRDIRKEASAQEVGQSEEFDKEFHDLRGRQYEMSSQQQEAFLAKDKQQLQSSILTKDTARRQAVNTEMKETIKAHNTQLLEEDKYGKTYAMIHKMMHSEIAQGTKNAFSELSAMQNSHNSTLKAIGKASAIAMVVIKTAESAMNIYAGFSEIPIVGPVLGVIGAAAAVAFGAEQIGDIQAAAQGGLIMGGIPGMDSVPVLAQQGELVSPAQNFEEVVGSVAARRMAAESGGAGGGVSHVVIGFDGYEAQNVLTARQTQAKALGTYRGVS